jgi:hypothetical protein
MKNELKFIQNSFTKESESISKEIETFAEKIKILENINRDLKTEQEKMKFSYEYEISKLTSDLKHSEEKLYLYHYLIKNFSYSFIRIIKKRSR